MYVTTIFKKIYIITDTTLYNKKKMEALGKQFPSVWIPS